MISIDFAGKTMCHQFWSPLFMTDVAKHSFSLTDHGSVGPITSSLCSTDVRWHGIKEEKRRKGVLMQNKAQYFVHLKPIL